MYICHKKWQCVSFQIDGNVFHKVIDDDDVDDDEEGKVDNEESIAAIGIDTRESIWLLICKK